MPWQTQTVNTIIRWETFSQQYATKDEEPVIATIHTGKIKLQLGCERRKLTLTNARKLWKTLDSEITSLKMRTPFFEPWHATNS